MLTITHTAAEGTTLHGTCRGDGTADLLKEHRWRWSRRLTAWYLSRSRDTAPQLSLIEATATALRAVGHDVDTEIDARSRTAAEVEADKIKRAADRSDRLDQIAERRAAQGQAAAARADRAAERVPPGGEPIKIGHHSETRHRNAIARSHRAMDASIAAAETARSAAARAEAARHATGARYSPVTVANRIATLRAEARRLQRELDGYSCTVGSYTEQHPAATGGHRDRLRRRINETADQLTYWTEVRHQQVVDGHASSYGPDTVQAGDLVDVRGRWTRVVRANKQSATLATDYSWTDRVPWHTVTDRAVLISVPDPDHPDGMHIYEGLDPETVLVDGRYRAFLSTDRLDGREDLEVAITISSATLSSVRQLR